MNQPRPFEPRRPSRGRTQIIAGIAGVVVAVAIFAAVLNVAGSGKVDVKLGDETFNAGKADRMAALIADGGPITYPDLLSRDRPIYLHHQGTDATTGWLAFVALAPGSDPANNCVLQWSGANNNFEDPCTDDIYDIVDDRLTYYPAAVTDGAVFIDLRVPSASTTTTPTTISPIRTGG